MSASTSTQQRGLVKEETSNSLVAPPEACVAYESQRFNDVINSFEKCLVNLSSNEHSLSSKALDLLSQSIRSDTICSGNQLKRVLELVKEKTKSRWPINSQIDIFLRLIHVSKLINTAETYRLKLIFFCSFPRSIHFTRWSFWRRMTGVCRGCTLVYIRIF